MLHIDNMKTGRCKAKVWKEDRTLGGSPATTQAHIVMNDVNIRRVMRERSVGMVVVGKSCISAHYQGIHTQNPGQWEHNNETMLSQCSYG